MLTESTYGLPRPRPIVLAQGPAYLDSILPSTVFDLDATIAASYSGSGTTWSNLTANPADGSAKTAYDFYTGDGVTGSTYPAFTGSAGNPSAYWSFDGGDYFSMKSGAITDFLARIHHHSVAGKGFWLAWAGNIPVPGALAHIFSTSDSSSEGALFQIQTISGNVRLRRRMGGSGNNIDTGSSIAGSDKLCVFSFNNETGDWRFWNNASTVTVSGVATTTGTNVSTSVPVIGAETDAGGPLPDTSKLYALGMGNEFLNDTKVAALFAHMNARHARVYG